jgi:hypothetical protein
MFDPMFAFAGQSGHRHEEPSLSVNDPKTIGSCEYRSTTATLWELETR